MNIQTMNQRPIVPMGIVMIPFIDVNLNPNKINCYTPAVVKEILSPDRMTVYEANGPRNLHEADPRACYPLLPQGQLLDADGTIVHHYGVGGEGRKFTVTRSATYLVGARGYNEILNASGAWVGHGLNPKNTMNFVSEQEARDYIAENLPAPALTRPFKVGDRVRTTKPRINSRNSDRFAIMTGTITRLNTGGYGWVTCEWDAECNPEGYANRDAYATYGLELLGG